MFDALGETLGVPLSRKGKKTDDEEEEEQDSKMQLATMMTKVVPVLLKVEEAIANFIVFVTPIYEAVDDGVNHVWEQLQPYGPDDIALVLYGVVQMFLGGFYINTFATLEAVSFIMVRFYERNG